MSNERTVSLPLIPGEFYRMKILPNAVRRAAAVCVLVTGWLFSPLPTGTAADDSSAPAPIRVDFEGPFEPVAGDGPYAKISGDIPPPLLDDSAWAELKLTYARDTERVFSGKSALSMTLKNITKGWGQLALRGVPLDKKHFVRLSVAMLAPSAMPVTLVIRKVAHPWTAYWEQTIPVTPEWKKFEFLIPPLADDPAAVVTLNAKADGMLVVDDLSLTFPSESEIENSAEPREGNLAPRSSFPLGLTGQWTISQGETGSSKAFSQPDVPGPTGAPSLEMGVGGERDALVNMNSRLVSPVFALTGGRPHGIGFFAKGSWDGQQIHISLFDPGASKNALSKTFRLGTVWEWFSFSGKLPYSLRGYYNLSISASERCWIDGITVVESGQPPSAPLRTDVTELAIRPGRPYAMFFDGDVMDCEFAVLGGIADGMKLAGSVKTPSGSTKALEEIPLAKETMASGKIRIPKSISREHGSYLAEFRVMDSENRPVSRPAELLLHRIGRPKMFGKDAPDSPFGTHINPTADQAAMAKGLGFNWIRLHDGGQQVTGWYFLEKTPGEFDFTYSDRAVEILRENHLKILGMLNMAPPFYTDCPADYPRTDHTKQYFVVKDEHRDKWQDYCRRIVSRNKGKIDDWEVLNEPYAGFGFFIKNAVKSEGGGYRVTAGSPENYVRLLGDAWTVAKEANPDSRLVWMMNHEAGWNDLCLRAGAADFCDIVSYHYYLLGNPLAGYPDTQVARMFSNRLRRDLAAIPKALPVWNTEGSTANLQVPWRYSPAFEEGACEKMANALVRSYIAYLSQGTDKWFVYTAHVYGVWGPFFYGFTAPDGSLAPGATALSAFMGLVEGKKFERSIQIADNVIAFLFADKTGAVAALASNSDKSKVLDSIPKGWTLLDMNGNPRSPSSAPLSSGNVIYLKSEGAPSEKTLGLLSAARLADAP